MNKIRHPLARAIADRLRTALQANRFENVLPGERELASSCNVGRDTIRAALAQLEREGWLSPAEDRHPRRIVRHPGSGDSDPPSPAVQRTSVGFLTSVPVTLMPQGILAELHDLRSRLEESETGFTIHEMTGNHSGAKQQNKLARLEAKHNHDCWLLYRATDDTQHWFHNRHIPALVRGSSYPGATLPCLDTDWKAAANHAAVHLWRNGHRTIGVCLPPESLKGHELVQKHLFAFEAGGWNPVVIPFPHDTTAIFDNLDHVFSKNPGLTAFITTRGDQAVTLLSWAAVRGLSIPEQISLLNLTYEPVLDHLYPAMACYRINTEKSVRRLVNMIRRIVDSKTIGNALIMPEFIPGQSVSERTKRTGEIS